MKAVLVGAGFAGRAHAAALRACGVEIAAVVTAREESARAFAKEWNIPAWGTDTSVALAPEIDAVHVCTPPTAHGAFIRELLAHGKHVVCEKPLSLDAEEARELAQLAEESGSHWVDLAQYTSGLRVEAVSASFGRFWPERSLKDGIMYPAGEPGEAMHVVSEDAAAVTLRFENGVLGNVMLSEVSPGRGNHLSLEITCENGALWWNEEDNNRLYTARKGEGVHTEVFAFGNGFDDTFALLFKNFYAAVAAGGTDCPSWPTFREGASVTAVCRAMGESEANGSAWTRVEGADA